MGETWLKHFLYSIFLIKYQGLWYFQWFPCGILFRGSIYPCVAFTPKSDWYAFSPLTSIATDHGLFLLKTRRTYQELVCLQMAGQLLQLMKVCTCTIYREYTVLNYGLSKQGFPPPFLSLFWFKCSTLLLLWTKSLSQN